MLCRIKYESHGNVAKKAIEIIARVFHISDQLRSGLKMTVKTPARGMVYTRCLGAKGLCKPGPVAWLNHRTYLHKGIIIRHGRDMSTCQGGKKMIDYRRERGASSTEVGILLSDMCLYFRF